MKTGFPPAACRPDRTPSRCNGCSARRPAGWPARSSSRRQSSAQARREDKGFGAVCSCSGYSAPIPGERCGHSLGRTWQVRLRILIKGKRQKARGKGQNARGKGQKARGKKGYSINFAFCLLPFAFCLLPFAFCLLLSQVVHVGQPDEQVAVFQAVRTQQFQSVGVAHIEADFTPLHDPE